MRQHTQNGGGRRRGWPVLASEDGSRLGQAQLGRSGCRWGGHRRSRHHWGRGQTGRVCAVGGDCRRNGGGGECTLGKCRRAGDRNWCMCRRGSVRVGLDRMVSVQMGADEVTVGMWAQVGGGEDETTYSKRGRAQTGRAESGRVQTGWVVRQPQTFVLK
jgi:hypothetical protein